MLPLLLCLAFARPAAGSLALSDLSELERAHMFGSASATPEFWLSWPEKALDADGRRLFSVRLGDDLFRFVLRPFPDLLSRLGFHSDAHTPLDRGLRHCVYTGHALSHNHTTISLLGCGQSARGLISSPSGHFLVHPLPPSHSRRLKRAAASGLHPHVVSRRDAPAFTTAGPAALHAPGATPCLFESSSDPYPETGQESFVRFVGSRRRDDLRLPVVRGPLTIELGVFADDAMWKHFRQLYHDDADSQLQQFILASVNNIHHLYSHESLDPKIQLKITRYQVMKSPPSAINKSVHHSGEVDLLLEGFCQFQQDVNPGTDSDPRHWDHALLFSGYDLYRGPLKSVAGYAPVKGMCSGIRSCTINEGLDFGAVFVITHEMGHSLGMYHDGDNGCSSRCCVMSPSVGTGKTSWSTCSVDEFNAFVNKLGTGSLPHNCLRDGADDPPALDHALHGFLPGQRYNLDQQCRIFHGDCWKHELRDGQKLEDICQMVWCGAGEGVIRTTHPALEGTHCGPNRWCISGLCAGWSSSSAVPRPVDGGWTAWNDSPESSCGGDGGGCSPCRLGAQRRVRRSVRHCELPPSGPGSHLGYATHNHYRPNNGGAVCKGSAFRAVTCSEERCSGPLPDQYASQVCTDLRNNANTPDLLLSGKGFQYEDAPCKVWCHMTVNNFIRSVANFPDGSPCGTDSFCVKGECQRLSCDGRALVSSARDCPADADAAGRRRIRPLSAAARRARRRKGTWASWSSWSGCTESCGPGSKTRRRQCRGRLCVGLASQSESCELRNCPTTTTTRRTTPTTRRSTTTTTQAPKSPTWASWGDWTECSVSCGTGRERRQRVCRNGSFRRRCRGRRFDHRRCSAPRCPEDAPSGSGWAEWGPWGSCTRSCDGGVHLRRRRCLGSLCVGRSTETETCGRGACPSQADRPQSGWSSWASWSECSRRCGGGTRFRTRKCDGDGVCFGSSVSFNACNLQSCRGSETEATAKETRDSERDTIRRTLWAPWDSWNSCTKGCDGGTQRRTRECGDKLERSQRLCRGLSSQSRSCNEAECEEAVGGAWATWGAWGGCCHGRGLPRQKELRYRRCEESPPCFGRWIQHRPCPKGLQSGSWSFWAGWSECSRTCGRGVSVRRRRCHTRLCIGSFRQIRYCNFEGCNQTPPQDFFLPVHIN